MPGIASFVAGPLLLLQLLPSSIPLALLGVGLVFFLSGSSVDLQLAILQTVVKVRMRAFASSIHFIAMNLCGMALAPLIIGMLNDALAPQFGNQAIRYSLAAAIPSSMLAGIFMMYGARFIRRDIKTALEEEPDRKL